jgi:hypothetical protein
VTLTPFYRRPLAAVNKHRGFAQRHNTGKGRGSGFAGSAPVQKTIQPTGFWQQPESFPECLEPVFNIFLIQTFLPGFHDVSEKENLWVSLFRQSLRGYGLPEPKIQGSNQNCHETYHLSIYSYL